MQIRSGVAGLSRGNQPPKPASALADAMASLMAKNTDEARKKGGSPTALEECMAFEFGAPCQQHFKKMVLRGEFPQHSWYRACVTYHKKVIYISVSLMKSSNYETEMYCNEICSNNNYAVQSAEFRFSSDYVLKFLDPRLDCFQ